MGNGFKVIDGGRGAGCGFLTDAEVDGFLAESLDETRLVEFDSHQSGGCKPCTLFAVDLRTFRDVVTEGPFASEQKRFDAVAEGQRSEFRDELARTGPGNRRSKVPVWMLSAAAAIVFVAFLGFQFLGPDGTPSIVLPDGSTYVFEAPAAPSRLRDGGDFARGRAAYAKADWAAATTAFAAVASGDPRYADARFYAGAASLLEGNTLRATELLEESRALASAAGLPTGEIEYYLALASAERGDVEAAIGLLEGIAFDPDAAELLDALRR